jgi:hypothetical protein
MSIIYNFSPKFYDLATENFIWHQKIKFNV